MGLLDFLTQGSVRAQPQQPQMVQPFEAPQPEAGGLLSSVPEALGQQAPQAMMQMPQLEQKPSLLGGILNWAKSPQGLATIGTGLSSWGGDENAGSEGMALGQLLRQNEAKAQERKKAQDDLARKNAAFRAAYQGGKFNPQAYMEALGDEGDAAEAISMAAKLAPEGGVDGGTAWTRDKLTGETTWGGQREESPAERLRREQMDEMETYRQEMIRLREEQLALSRQREGRVAAGGGGRGGGGRVVPSLPPGFVIEK